MLFIYVCANNDVDGGSYCSNFFYCNNGSCYCNNYWAPITQCKDKEDEGRERAPPPYDKNKTFFFLVMHYLLAFTTIVVYTHTTNDKNQPNNVSFLNQNMIHLQTGKNLSQNKWKRSTQKPCKETCVKTLKK